MLSWGCAFADFCKSPRPPLTSPNKQAARIFPAPRCLPSRPLPSLLSPPLSPLLSRSQGSLTLEKKPFMVRDLLTTTMSQVIVAAHEKQLECNIDIDPAALYLSFISDGSRIQQVLANFGWNATKVRTSMGPLADASHRSLSGVSVAWMHRVCDEKRSLLTPSVRSALFPLSQFTAQGGIVFRMRLVTTNVDNRTGELSSAVVRFEVEDTGSGVDPEVAKTLFLPFDKDTFSRQGKHGGSGLGLNICKARELAGGCLFGFVSSCWSGAPQRAPPQPQLRLTGR